MNRISFSQDVDTFIGHKIFQRLFHGMGRRNGPVVITLDFPSDVLWFKASSLHHFVWFLQTRIFTPHCLSPPRCTKWVPAAICWAVTCDGTSKPSFQGVASSDKKRRSYGMLTGSGGGGPDPASRSFFTRISHPALFSSLSRIPFFLSQKYI